MDDRTTHRRDDPPPSDEGAHAGNDRAGGYKSGSLSLAGAVSLGTGVMIGAGIFALTGQMAELSGGWFPLAFLAAAVVALFSTYSYIKLSTAHPSAGGIAMYLKQAYGEGVLTAGMALLMYFSMVINESLVARTFAEYTMQLFTSPGQGSRGGGSVFTGNWIVPMIGVGVLALAGVINFVGNRVIDRISLVMAVVKIGGILVFVIAGLWASGFDFATLTGGAQAGDGASAQRVYGGLAGFLAATTLGVLAYKGFTTITNDGDEIRSPRRNLPRAILIAMGICVLLYLLVAIVVAGSLDLGRIIDARDYSLAEAARPAFGQWGLWLTVALAIVATISGVIASVFAVSRMLAMLVKMDLVPFHRLGIPGRRQHATLVYTLVLAMILTLCFDLSRIASLGAVFYLVMDIAIHWGLLRRLRTSLDASPVILSIAIGLDVLILGAFVWVKSHTDPLVIIVAAGGIVVIFIAEAVYLRNRGEPTGEAG